MKKYVCYLLAGLISLGALAACGPKPGGDSTVDPASSPELDPANKPTLELLMTYVPFDPNQDRTAKFLEEATGYKVNYSVLPNEDAQTKLNTIIASKESFDILSLDKSLFYNTVGTNAYQPLDELLPQYAPDLQKLTDKGLWTNVTIDNKIMGIPQGLANETYGLVYRIRMDLFKKAGIEKNPETPDELYAALKAVWEKLHIIPLTSNMALIPEIESGFGICFDGDKKFTVENGKITYMAEAAGMKDYLAFMNKLYNENLLDNEFAQNTGTLMQEKFFGGKAAVYQLGWWNEPTATNTIMEKAPEAELAYMNPLKDANGQAMLPQNRGVDRVVAIPRVSKNKEYALDYLNAKVKGDTFKGMCMGVEGKDYTDLGDGKYEPILPAFFDDCSNAQYFLTGTDTALYESFWSQTRVKKDPILYREFNNIQALANQAVRYYDPTSYMQPNKTYSDLLPKVNKLADDTFKQFITGTKPLSEYDSFMAELNATGLNEIRQIVNDWWAQKGSSLSDMLVKK